MPRLRGIFYLYCLQLPILTGYCENANLSLDSTHHQNSIQITYNLAKNSPNGLLTIDLISYFVILTDQQLLLNLR